MGFPRRSRRKRQRCPAWGLLRIRILKIGPQEQRALGLALLMHQRSVHKGEQETKGPCHDDR